MRYMPLNNDGNDQEPDSDADDVRRRPFSAMFQPQAAQVMGGRPSIMMGQAPDIAPDAAMPQPMQGFQHSSVESPMMPAPMPGGASAVARSAPATLGHTAAAATGAAQGGHAMGKMGALFGKIAGAVGA